MSGNPQIYISLYWQTQLRWSGLWVPSPVYLFMTREDTSWMIKLLSCHVRKPSDIFIIILGALSSQDMFYAHWLVFSLWWYFHHQMDHQMFRNRMILNTDRHSWDGQAWEFLVLYSSDISSYWEHFLKINKRNCNTSFSRKISWNWFHRKSYLNATKWA